MDQRLHFIAAYERAVESMTELCARYRISRKTGYKWLTRYITEGPAGLVDRSRRPHRCPHSTPAPIVAALLAARRRRPSWSAKKLLWQLSQQHPTWRLPALSTAQALLQRHGLVRSPRRRRRPRGHPGARHRTSRAPNDLWTADFKGEFKTRDGCYCYPLTVIDDYSRYVLACDAFLHPTHAATRATFRRLFRTYGLPSAIRTDNGTPFASPGLARLSRLALWWLRLEITPLLSAPGHPEHNSRHERFHKTLKAETTRPPAASCAAQHRRFARFRHDFNHCRPHEALQQTPPARCYVPAARRYQPRLTPLTYPAHFECRRVGTNGCLRWQQHRVFAGRVFAGQVLGFDERAEGEWDVYFTSQLIGRLHEHDGRLEDLTP